MKILFISPTIPYPPTDGGKIRVFNLLKQLRLQNEVTLLSLLSFQTSPQEQRGIKEVEKLGIKVEIIKPKGNLTLNYKAVLRSIFCLQPLTVAKYYDKEMAQRVAEHIESGKFDLIHFEMIHMGQYIKAKGERRKNIICRGNPLWLPSCRGEPLCSPMTKSQIVGAQHAAPKNVTILSEQNIDSDVWKRMYEKADNPIRKFILWTQCKLFERYEKALCPLFEFCICVSERDRELLLKFCPGLRVEVIPNGVDLDLYKPDENLEDESMLLFTGSMDWFPNEDSVISFCDEILPRIQKERPDVKFYIVGQNPSDKVEELSNRKGVTVTGRVDDVKPYLNQASVYVVPLRLGGGTRLKILEALAMKKAVVSTALGAEGLELSNGKDILIADSPDKFARLVLKLLGDGKLRRELGQNGRRTVEEKYGWDRIGEKLNSVYKSKALDR